MSDRTYRRWTVRAWRNPERHPDLFSIFDEQVGHTRRDAERHAKQLADRRDIVRVSCEESEVPERPRPRTYR